MYIFNNSTFPVFIKFECVDFNYREGVSEKKISTIEIPIYYVTKQKKRVNTVLSADIYIIKGYGLILLITRIYNLKTNESVPIINNYHCTECNKHSYKSIIDKINNLCTHETKIKKTKMIEIFNKELPDDNSIYIDMVNFYKKIKIDNIKIRLVPGILFYYDIK